MKADRIHYIDLVRGIAVLGIIFIHTCFHSGDAYVPKMMQSLSLLVDVPLFFFVSGMTQAVVKKDMIIPGIFKFSIIFTLLSLILNMGNRALFFEQAFLPLFLSGIKLPEFWKAVEWSYWFVPVYVTTVILSMVIIKMTDRAVLMIILFLAPYAVELVTEPLDLSTTFLGVPLRSVLFLSALFLFGYWCFSHVLYAKGRKCFALIVLVTALIMSVACYWKFGHKIFVLQDYKFPFELPYVAISFVSIAFTIFFYDENRQNKWLEYLGRNALYYYAGQGVSASLLFVVEPHISLVWGIKLLIMFAFNVVLTILFSELIKRIYQMLVKVF